MKYVGRGYLSQGVGQGGAEEEVGIGGSSLDPEEVEDRTEDGRDQKHHQHHQRVAQVWDEERYTLPNYLPYKYSS